jgi:hypothetical protein
LIKRIQKETLNTFEKRIQIENSEVEGASGNIGNMSNEIIEKALESYDLKFERAYETIDEGIIGNEEEKKFECVKIDPIMFKDYSMKIRDEVCDSTHCYCFVRACTNHIIPHSYASHFKIAHLSTIKVNFRPPQE